MEHIDFIQDLIAIFIVYGLLGIVIIEGIKYLYKYIRYHNKEFTPNDIEKRVKNMSPREFEIFCGNLFKSAGYTVKVTEATCDGGKDVIAINEEDTIYIECKHYKEGNLVGREILQKLVGASIGGGATKAILITTSGYNDNAYTYAKTVDWLELWTMEDIINIMYKIDKQWYALYNLEK